MIRKLERNIGDMANALLMLVNSDETELLIGKVYFPKKQTSDKYFEVNVSISDTDYQLKCCKIPYSELEKFHNYIHRQLEHYEAIKKGGVVDEDSKEG